MKRMRSNALTRALTGVCLCLLILGLAAGCTQQVKRYGSVIEVKAETLEKYKQMHAEPWPEINAQITECNIRNYSIYLTQFPSGKYYLFAYYEYTGDDFDADMALMEKNPKMKEWWSHTDPMQIPLENKAKEEWWKNMEEVYHLD